LLPENFTVGQTFLLGRGIKTDWRFDQFNGRAVIRLGFATHSNLYLLLFGDAAGSSLTFMHKLSSNYGNRT